MQYTQGQRAPLLEMEGGRVDFGHCAPWSGTDPAMTMVA
jgi:hypothetical protein